MNQSDKDAIAGSIRAFDRAALSYDQFAVLQRQVSEHLFDICRKYLGNGKIADLGCGTGYFHELLRKNKIYQPLVQIDIAEKMCEIARSYASSGEFGETQTICADISELPLPDNSLDFVFSSLTMQWVPDKEKTIRHILSKIKPGGYFAFSIIADGSLKELQKAYILLGKEPRINDFIDQGNLEKILEKVNPAHKEISNEIRVINHRDIESLLKSLKGVGAGYSIKGKAMYPGRNFIHNLERVYKENFGDGDNFPISWNVLYVLIGK